MLIVKTKIKPSKIDGLGLFADQDIEKGDVVYQYIPYLETIISETKFISLPKFIQEKIAHYGVKYKEKYYISWDGDQFMNHSDNPNVKDCGRYTATLRNIKKGEELTCNYYEFDELAEEKLNDKK